MIALYNVLKEGTLEEFLDKIFASAEKETTVADEKTKAKFAYFMQNYKKGLSVEMEATKKYN